MVTDGDVADKKISLKKGGSAVWFVVPTDGTADKLAKLAGNHVTGSSVTYSLDGDVVTTTLTYEADGGDRVRRPMPHQAKDARRGIKTDLGTYPSIYGTLKSRSGNELTYTAPLSQPTSRAGRGHAEQGREVELAEQVTKDIAATKDSPADTYFGGKKLYRAAMLCQLAKQLELTGPAKHAWATPSPSS